MNHCVREVRQELVSNPLDWHADHFAAECDDTCTMTRAQLEKLLRHPDGQVRSLADWTREYRGWGWRRQVQSNATAANEMERELWQRLATYNRDYAALQNDLNS